MSAVSGSGGDLEAAFIESIEASGDYGAEWAGLVVLGRLTARNIDEAGSIDSQEQRKALNLSHYFLNVWDRLGLPSHAEGESASAPAPSKGTPTDEKFVNARATVMDIMKDIRSKEDRDGA